MINTSMRLYDYYLYGDADEYGQPTLSYEPQGRIKMAIYIASQHVKDSIAYSGTEYVGLAMDNVDDKYVIEYKTDKLKVLYVNPMGMYKQVYMSRM